MVYLDNHTLTEPCGPALEQLQDRSTSSVETKAQIIYDLVGAEVSDKFVFTSSGTEAINQVHWTTFIEIARKEGKCHLITSPVEDAPMMQSLKRLEELGCFVKIAPLDENGQIDLEQLRELITPRTAMISIGWAQGLTGVVQPIEEIGALAKEKGVLFHVDGTYALGKVHCSLQDIAGLHYLTFSGDRIHGVQGTGGLFAKKGSPLVPFIVGGTEQGGLRGGSFEQSSFRALCAASGQASLSLDLMSLEVARLRDRFEEGVLHRVTDAKALFKEALRLPNVSTLCFPAVHQELLLYTLERKGVLAAIGGTSAPYLSRVLIAYKIAESVAQTSISFSLSRYTTEKEIDRAVELIVESLNELRPLAEELL